MSNENQQSGSEQQSGADQGRGQLDDAATTSATDDSSVGIGNQAGGDDTAGSQPGSEPSKQDAHNPETDEDTASGGPAD